jgi:hypothetical protein
LAGSLRPPRLPGDLEDHAALCVEPPSRARTHEAKDIACDLSVEGLSVGADVELDAEADREVVGEFALCRTMSARKTIRTRGRKRLNCGGMQRR